MYQLINFFSSRLHIAIYTPTNIAIYFSLLVDNLEVKFFPFHVVFILVPILDGCGCCR